MHLSSENKFFLTLGLEYENLFKGYENEKNFVSKLIQDYDVKHGVQYLEHKKCLMENYFLASQ